MDSARTGSAEPRLGQAVGRSIETDRSRNLGVDGNLVQSQVSRGRPAAGWLGTLSETALAIVALWLLVCAFVFLSLVEGHTLLHSNVFDLVTRAPLG